MLILSIAQTKALLEIWGLGSSHIGTVYDKPTCVQALSWSLWDLIPILLLTTDTLPCVVTHKNMNSKYFRWYQVTDKLGWARAEFWLCFSVGYL